MIPQTFFLACFWATPASAQGLLLACAQGPGSAQGTILDARDQIQVTCVQGKHIYYPLYCLSGPQTFINVTVKWLNFFIKIFTFKNLSLYKVVMSLSPIFGRNKFIYMFHENLDWGGSTVLFLDYICSEITSGRTRGTM